MSCISVSLLNKCYRLALRGRGLGGALKGLVAREHKEIWALRDVSFTVEEGEILGYIGPNGAGKSTTIKILSGIMRPDGGECTVDGMVPWENRIAHVRRIGVVFGQRTQLWWDLPTVESFELLKRMYRVPEASYRESLDELVELLSLTDLLPVPVRQLSLGQRMRCELAASLVHSPRILFLDEPTIGLDAEAKIAVRHFIREYNQRRNVTIILTTHDMDDIEELSHRILVLKEGELIYRGDVDGLRVGHPHAPDRRPGCRVGTDRTDRREALPGGSRVRGYLALFSTVFQQHLQYRVSAIAGAFTNIAFGFFRLFLLTAFYRASDAVQPMTLPELYSYLWFGQVLFGVLPIVGLSRYSMSAPDPRYLPLLLVSVLLTMILSAAIHTFVYMTGFWTISVRGSASLVYAVTGLFSGLLVPLAFFPPALKRLAEFLPFRAIYDTPAMLYNGSIDPARIAGALGHQVIWLALILMAGWMLARRGTALLEVAGG